MVQTSHIQLSTYCVNVGSDIFTSSRGTLLCWTSHFPGISRPSHLVLGRSTSNPEGYCLVSSCSSTILYTLIIALISDQSSCLQSTQNFSNRQLLFLSKALNVLINWPSTYKNYSFLLVMGFQRIWLESVWYTVTGRNDTLLPLFFLPFSRFLCNGSFKLVLFSVVLLPFCHDTDKII